MPRPLTRFPPTTVSPSLWRLGAWRRPWHIVLLYAAIAPIMKQHGRPSTRHYLRWADLQCSHIWAQTAIFKKVFVSTANFRSALLFWSVKCKLLCTDAALNKELADQKFTSDDNIIWSCFLRNLALQRFPWDPFMMVLGIIPVNYRRHDNVSMAI